MKKLTAALLAIILLATSLLIPGTVVFAQGSSGKFHKNPFYEHREIPNATLEAYEPENSISRKYGGYTYYSLGKQLSTQMRSAIEQRKKSLNIRLLSQYRFYSGDDCDYSIDILFNDATEDYFSRNGIDGDYSRWAVEGWESYYYEEYNQGGYFYYDVVIDMWYYDTANQEQLVDAKVNNIVNNLNTSSMSDFEILRYIHDYICDSTTYDDDAVEAIDKLNYGRISNDYFVANYGHAFSAYGALVKGKCVCQGYSVAFYRICKELGYSVRVITSDTHAWNLVGINGKYYYVDVTWDDEIKDNNYASSEYYYFLVDYDELISDDTDDVHYPEEQYYDGAYYNTTYANYIDDECYDSTDVNLLSNCVVSISTKKYVYDGLMKRPSVVVRAPDSSLVNGDNYTISYSNNINTGTGSVVVTGKNAYADSVSKRQFDITPKAMSSIRLASGGRGATTLVLEWNKAEGNVSGYKIEEYRSGKWVVVATVGGSYTKATVSSLAAAKSHKLRIRAYTSMTKRMLYGGYSSTLTTCTTSKKPTVSLKSANRSITVNWKKIDASGFELQYSANKSFSKAGKVVIKKNTTSKKITNLTKGKKYFVRVRSYKIIGGKKYYSQWSAVKSLKCK